MVLNAAMEELQHTLRQRAQSAMDLLHQGIISTEQKLEQCLSVLSSVQEEVRQHQQAVALTIQDDYTRRLQELTDAFEQQVLSLQQETQSQLEDLQTAAADALQQAAQVLLHELQLDYPADAATATGTTTLSTESCSQGEGALELSFAALKRPASPDQAQQLPPTTLQQGPGGPDLFETHWHNQGQADSGQNQPCSRASSKGRRAASLLAPAGFCKFSSVTAKDCAEAQHTGADTLSQPWDQAPAEAVPAEPPTEQLSGPCHASFKQQQPQVMQPQQQLQGEEQQQDAVRPEQPLQQQQQQQQQLPGHACIEHAVQAVLPAPTLHTASTVGASAHQRSFSSRAGSSSIKTQAELQSPQPLHCSSSTTHQQQHHGSTDCQYALGCRRHTSEEGWQIRAAEQPAGGRVSSQQSLGALQPPSSPGLSWAHQPFCKAYRCNSFSSNSTSANSRSHSMCGNDLTSTCTFATPTVSPSRGSEPRQQRWQTQAEPSRQLRKVASLPVQECAVAKQRSLRKCVSSTESVLRRAPSWRQQLESGWQQGLAKAAGKAAATNVNSLDDVAALQAKLSGPRGSLASLAAADVSSSDDDDGPSPSKAAAAAVKHLPGLAVNPPRTWQQSLYPCSFDMASTCNVQVAAQNGAVKRSSSMCSSKFSKAGATSCKSDRHGCSSFLELLEC